MFSALFLLSTLFYVGVVADGSVTLPAADAVLEIGADGKFVNGLTVQWESDKKVDSVVTIVIEADQFIDKRLIHVTPLDDETVTNEKVAGQTYSEYKLTTAILADFDGTNNAPLFDASKAFIEILLSDEVQKRIYVDVSCGFCNDDELFQNVKVHVVDTCQFKNACAHIGDAAAVKCVHTAPNVYPSCECTENYYKEDIQNPLSKCIARPLTTTKPGDTTTKPVNGGATTTTTTAAGGAGTTTTKAGATISDPPTGAATCLTATMATVMVAMAASLF
eukprot:TRINITY_DN4978_c0_g1_i1.p2 TRINITY_DN4978_c0_g1~~TRINITY_DN4978_c0_g1_i1.p2  ORF type:complete len:288 (-),score=80.83 TRINITY_DN4978_c0_g1_i1:93-923(-)